MALDIFGKEDNSELTLLVVIPHDPNKIARMPDDKRIAILVAFIRSYETIALDDAMDLLDLLITSITGDAKKIGQKKRLRTLKDLDKSALLLAGQGLKIVL